MNELIVLLVRCLSFARKAVILNVDVKEHVVRVLKDYVDANTAPPSDQFKLGSGMLVPCMTLPEIETARFTGKLDAIKAYKNRTGLYLIDSKHSVEQQIEAMGYHFHSY